MDTQELLTQLRSLHQQRNSLRGEDEGQRWLARVAALIEHIDPSRAEEIRQRAQVLALPLSVTTIEPTWRQVLQLLEDVIANLESGAHSEPLRTIDQPPAGAALASTQPSEPTDVEKLSIAQLFKAFGRLSIGSVVFLVTVAAAALGAAYKLGTLARDPNAQILQPVAESKRPNCGDYRILITSAAFVHPFRVAGVSNPLPQGFELWLFATSGPTSPEAYWPHAKSEVEGGKWSVDLSPDDLTPGKTKRFAVFVVGKDGQAVIKYYKLAMGHLPKGMEWPPLEPVTSDMLKCTPGHEVTLTQERTP